MEEAHGTEIERMHRLAKWWVMMYMHMCLRICLLPHIQMCHPLFHAAPRRRNLNTELHPIWGNRRTVFVCRCELLTRTAIFARKKKKKGERRPSFIRWVSCGVHEFGLLFEDAEVYVHRNGGEVGHTLICLWRWWIIFDCEPLFLTVQTCYFSP